MQIYKGKTGLNKTWQEPFGETIPCQKCGKEAKIMFVACEGDEDEGNVICSLHQTTCEKGGLWFHDSVSVAVYACPFCLEVTALANQA